MVDAGRAAMQIYLDPPRLLCRSAHELAMRTRMKARAQVESSPGVEAPTANLDSV